MGTTTRVAYCSTQAVQHSTWTKQSIAKWTRWTSAWNLTEAWAESAKKFRPQWQKNSLTGIRFEPFVGSDSTNQQILNRSQWKLNLHGALYLQALDTRDWVTPLRAKRIKAKKNPWDALTPQRFGALSMPESFYYESLEEERVVTALISSVHRYSLDTEKSQGTLPMFFSLRDNCFRAIKHKDPSLSIADLLPSAALRQPLVGPITSNRENHPRDQSSQYR